jgi:hypothetical protein
MRLPSLVALLVWSLSGGLPAAPATAHPGGLDANGCHHNRKTGDYHCHRGSSPARSSPLSNGAGTISYRNCAEARAAGAAPIYRGQPGYADHLDRDGDGIACEPYRGR